jgi:hypothetical protein
MRVTGPSRPAQEAFRPRRERAARTRRHGRNLTGQGSASGPHSVRRHAGRATFAETALPRHGIGARFIQRRVRTDKSFRLVSRRCRMRHPYDIGREITSRSVRTYSGCRFPFLVSPQEPVSRTEPDGPAIWPPGPSRFPVPLLRLWLLEPGFPTRSRRRTEYWHCSPR